MTTKLDGLLTPGGRFVMGDLMVKGDKDSKGALIPPDKQAYFFGVAIPKTTPGVGDLINQLWSMAATSYAQVPLVMQQINQGLAAKDFAWKIQDGDVPTYDKKTGQLRQTPEHLLGCYIFKFSTKFEIGACDEGNPPTDIHRSAIKRGDYVDVAFNSSANGNVDDTAGIYLNPVAIRRLGFGEAISGQLPASSAFAGKAAVMPAGATAMPQASSPMPGTGMPQQGMGMPSGHPSGYVPAQMPGVSAGGGMAMPTAQPMTVYPAPSYPAILGMPGLAR